MLLGGPGGVLAAGLQIGALGCLGTAVKDDDFSRSDVLQVCAGPLFTQCNGLHIFHRSESAADVWCSPAAAHMYTKYMLPGREAGRQ